ncbi:hypothetical protein [Kitasatospora cineracea]|uniref:hypothetical protein n=1 Tax=Kitasatospora cineracea TaxID=88074 RepID=UPI0037FC684F
MSSHRSVPTPGPLLEQLAESRFVLDLNAAPGPGGPRALPVRSRSGPDPVPCVLLLGRAGDAEFGAVARLLRRAGTPVVQLDPAAQATGPFCFDPAAGVLASPNGRLRPTVAWARHAPPPDLRPGDALDRFARTSWAELVAQVGASAPVSVPVRRPGLLEQLRAATALGVVVPRTLVSTDTAAAAASLGSRQVVVKALGSHFVETAPGRLTGVFPEVHDRAELIRRTGAAPGPPVVVQEYVEHSAELRVYYVRGEVLAYHVVKSSPSAPWTGPDTVRVGAVRAPTAVVRAAGALAAEWDLRYGAFDFLLRPDGEPVFLEANLNGDWRWHEAATGDLRVTRAAARMLRDLHTEASAPGGPGIELLAFLCG